MITLRPYQRTAVEALRGCIRKGAKRVMVCAPTGSGKCLGLGTKVMRFDGTRVPVEDVAAGEYLMGPDGQPRRVLSTTIGDGPLFRITPVKGEPWVCNDVHVLTLVNTTTGNVIDIPLNEYLRKSKTFKHLHKQFTPPKGIDFPAAPPLLIDPYFVGVWLGDGTKGLDGSGQLRKVAITKPDPEIYSLCAAVAGEFGCRVRTDGPPSRTPTHHLVTDLGKPNPLLTRMRRVLGDASVIPSRYLTGSRADRQRLLAGLLDTDGHLSSGCFDIVQKNKAYADGISFVARSLGLRATQREKVVNGETYHRVSLSGDFSQLPLRIPRKQASPRKQVKVATRTGFKVEPIGNGTYAGFELDGDGRFLLGDFTVTHNTVLAAHIIAAAVAKGNRVLFCAHRRELVRQPFFTLIRAGILPIDIGVIMAGMTVTADGTPSDPNSQWELWQAHARRRPGAPVQIASIDTLRRRATKPPADLIIIDEAHRALAKSYVDLLDGYPDAAVIGLTATPQRSDGRGLNEVFDEMVTVARYSELVESGHLVAPRVWSAPTLPDLSGVRMKGRDYDPRQLQDACNKATLTGDIVDHYRKHGNGQPALCFAVGVEHSQAIAEQFQSAGIPAAHVDGNTPVMERDHVFAALQSGELKVVSNCDVATEGTDIPCVKTVIMARPTKSLRVFLQQAGRGSRPWRGAPFVVLDHAGNAVEHGLPQADREWSLDGKEKDAAGGSVWTCPDCYAVNPSAEAVCAECGCAKPVSATPERSGPEQVDGELTELTGPAEPTLTEEERRAAWQAIVDEWHTHDGYSPRWCYYQFRKRHKCDPPKNARRPRRRAPVQRWATDEEITQALRRKRPKLPPHPRKWQPDNEERPFRWTI